MAREKKVKPVKPVKPEKPIKQEVDVIRKVRFCGEYCLSNCDFLQCQWIPTDDGMDEYPETHCALFDKVLDWGPKKPEYTRTPECWHKFGGVTLVPSDD